MLCVCAFYPAAGEGRFDKVYYREKHIPLVKQLLAPYGLTKLEVDEGMSGYMPGSLPNYLMIARMYFQDVEGFQAGLAAVGGEIFADIPNYTDIPVEVQVSNCQEH